MEAGKVREALVQILQWYIQASGAQDPPTTEALDEVTVERAELYRCRPTDVLRVPLLVPWSDSEDGIQTEAEVAAEARGLKRGRAGGPIRNPCRRLEGTATGGNAQEGTGEEKVGYLGEISTSDVRGRDPNGGACMGNNDIHPKREGGVLGYWVC